MLINIDKLKQQIKNNKTAKDFFSRAYSEIKAEDFEQVYQQLINFQSPYKHSFTILKAAYCCKLADDKSLEKPIHDLVIAFCNLKKWEEQGARNGWVSDLLTGDALINLSITFTIARDLFSDDEQELIRRSLLEKGFFPLYNEWLNPETRIHCLDTMGHNWWAVCLGGAGVAMILADDSTPNKRQYINEIALAFKTWFRYEGDIYLNKPLNWGQDGDYSEYAGYMMYGTTNMTIFEEMYRRFTGDSTLIDNTPLCNTPDFMLSFMQEINGKYEFVKFSDTHSENSGALTMLYYANRFNRGDMVTAFSKFNYNTANPLAFIHLEKLNVEPAPIEYRELAVFNDTGLASYKKDDIFFAIKTGDSSCHNHRDCGTFTITYKDREMIIDSGTCLYGKSEYLDYFCAPEAHNVVLFNGQGIRKDAMYGGGIHNIGVIASAIDEPDYKYILADCTAPYTNILQRNMRHVYFIKDMIIMIDDIYSEADGEAEFLLHYKGSLTADGGQYTVNNDGAQMIIRPIMPNNLVCSEADGYEGVNHLIEPTKYLRFKTKTNNKRMKFITAFIFDKNIKLEQKQTGEILELKVDRGDYTERFIINYVVERKDTFNNAHFEYDNIKTNAFVTYLKENENGLIGGAVTNGFYFKYNGELVYTSFINEERYIK